MSNGFNPRLTIMIVFAFLFIVALFVSPGGPVDQVVPPGEIANAEPLPQPAARATATTSGNPWYTQEEPTPPAVSPTPAGDPDSGGAPNDGGMAAGNAPAPAGPAPAGPAPAGPAPAGPAGGEPVSPPLPQGPDFPENR